MQISNEADDDKIDALSIELETLFNKHPDLTHVEIMVTCMLGLSNVLMSMSCPDCRQKSAQYVRKKLPRFIDDALAEGQKRDGDRSLSDHVH
jgi:hypothetical protein